VRPVINATARLVMKPFAVGEWLMPPGSRVVTGIAPLHKDNRFHANARRFEPDRYVGKKPDTYAWIPFGGGMRRCIGAAFAQFEIDIVLRTLLRHFELQTTTEQGERESFRGVAFAPSKGGMTAVRRRKLGGPAADQSAAEPASADLITALNS
jgi:cytochrome P450